MKKALGMVCALAVGVPWCAHAQVIISEFLYDAQGVDDTQEWIELYNAGSAPVDISKWKISDGSNHVLNIPPKNGGIGSTQIAPGGYMILADDAPAFIARYPGVASVIDTTLDLPNTSGTLTLLGEDGAAANTVAYTKELGAAGDGTSLQLSGSAWIAAAPTPGQGNVAASAAPPVQQSASTSTDTGASAQQTAQKSAPATPVSSYVAPPEPQLFADAGDDRAAIVGADAEFRGRAYNRKKESVETARFSWNFGDGSTAEGHTVLHHFDYPGRYAVMLTIAHDVYAVSDRVIVTAEPARLAFNVHPDGSAAIANMAGRDLDLSRWIVRSFGREFLLPAHTLVLAGETLRIGGATLDFPVGPQTELAYPNGTLALRAAESSGFAVPTPAVVPVAPTAPEARTFHAPAIAAQTSAPAKRSIAPAEISPPVRDEVPEDSVQEQSSAAAQAAAAGALPVSPWWAGALTLALFAGGAAAYLSRSRGREWDIVEKTTE